MNGFTKKIIGAWALIALLATGAMIMASEPAAAPSPPAVWEHPQYEPCKRAAEESLRGSRASDDARAGIYKARLATCLAERGVL